MKYWVNCAKNKVMLDLYGQLLQKHCFSRSEVESLVGNRKKTDNVIYALKTKGLIKSVRKNLYTAISLEDKSPVSSKYEIASHISHGSFISHHTAFEFYGLANQLYYEVFVSSKFFSSPAAFAIPVRLTPMLTVSPFLTVTNGLSVESESGSVPA